MRCIGLWVGLIAGSAYAQPLRFEMPEMQYEVRTADLASGLRVVLQQDRSKPLVAVAVVVDVGSAADPIGQEGLAHLVAHLAFRARPDGKRSHTDLLEISGAGAWNEFTEHDLTTYYALASAEALPELLALEMSCVLDPLKGVDPGVFEAEREVVRNELRERDELGLVGGVSTQLMASLYPVGHPYSRPSIGTDASISKLTMESARAFVAEHYRPPRMTLVIAGDLDLRRPGEVLRGLPQAVFDKAAPDTLQKLPRVALDPGVVPAVPAGPQIVRLKAPVDVPTLNIGWSLPRSFDKSGPAQLAVYTALSGPLSGVFRDEDVTGLRTRLQRGKTGSTLVVTVLLAQGKNPDKVFERALDQLFKLYAASGDVFNSRRQMAVAGARGGWLQQGKASSVVQFAARWESILERTLALAEAAHLTGDALGPIREIDATASIPRNDLSAFVASWLTRERARAVFVEPGGSATEHDSTPAVFASVSSLKLAVPEERFAKRIVRPWAGLKTILLQSGLEVVLAHRASGPVVAITLAAKGGSSDAQPVGAANMAEYAEIPQDYHGVPWGIGISRTWWSESSTSYLQLRAASGNLRDALGMLRDAVDSIHVDSSTSSAFDYYVKDRAQRVYDLPAARADRELMERIHAGTPFARTPSPVETARVSPGQANGWLAETWTPSNSVLTIAGDLSRADVDTAVRQLLEDWAPKARRTAATVVLPSSPVDAPVPVLTTARPGARQTVATLGCAVPVNAGQDLAALRVLAERMSMRLHQTSRLVLGATYGFSHSVELKRGIGELRVSGALEERGLTRVLALLRRDAATLGSQALPTDELDRARWREGIKSNARLQHATDLGMALADLRLSGLPVDTFERYPSLLAKLEADDVIRVAKECRKTVVIDLLGDPATVEKAVRATGS